MIVLVLRGQAFCYTLADMQSLIQKGKNSIVALAVDDDLLVIQQHLQHHHLSAAQHLRLQTGEAADALCPLFNASAAAIVLMTLLPQDGILNKMRKSSKRTEEDDDKESLSRKQDAQEMSIRSPMK